MGVFEQIGPEFPAVVDAYHRARKAYIDAMVGGDLDPTAYCRALHALTLAVRERGGEWTVGRLIYKDTPAGLECVEVPGLGKTDWDAVAADAIREAEARLDAARKRRISVDCAA